VPSKRSPRRPMGSRRPRAGLDTATGTAAQALQQAQVTVDNDIQAIKSAQANLAVTKATATAADLASAQAAVQNAQVSVQQAQANLDATTLTAPIAATVAQVSGSVGQYTSGGTASTTTTGTANSSGSTGSGFILLTNLSALQVVAQVNEADMAKIALGDPVQFTVDAFPGQRFAGKVTVIQPLGTTTNNIVNYNVTSAIDPTPTKLLPGMTASADIITASAANVVTVPAAAISYARAQAQQQAGSASSSRFSSTQSGASAGGVQGQAASRGGQQGQTSQSARSTQTGNGAPGQASGRGQAGAAGAPSGGQGAQRTRGQGAGGGFGQAGTAPGNAPGTSRAPVLVMTNGKPTLQVIEIGLSDGRNTQVISGLNPGATVVIGTASGAGPAGGSGAGPAAGGGAAGRPGGGGGAPLGGRGFGG
jgi:HlyD family secretion protein